MAETKHKFNFADDFIGYANIKVVGIGGGGGNAVNRMIESGLRGVEFICVNTDSQVLDQCLADTKIQIGKEVTGGLGAGAEPGVGMRAMEESRQQVVEAIGNPNMVFITAGMGGGTGTGGAPVLAEIAKAAGALTVAIVTRPFRFEGNKRIQRANQGLAELKSKVDTLITIPNERLLQIVDKRTKLTEAFAIADEILYQATKGISDLITIPGLINCDFADVRTVMSEMGNALMGTGFGTGDDKATDAARQAISSPLLEDVAIGGAQGVLINVTGGDDMTLFDVNTATSLIYEEAGSDANIIFGAVIDPEMENQMRVTVIATGIGECESRQTIVQKLKAETCPSGPAKPMSLFPDNAVVLPQQPRAVAQPIDPAAAVASTADQSDQLPTFSENPRISGGNGGSNVVRNRVPMFSEDDLTIPAYIRRLDENN